MSYERVKCLLVHVDREIPPMGEDGVKSFTNDVGLYVKADDEWYFVDDLEERKSPGTGWADVWSIKPVGEFWSIKPVGEFDISVLAIYEAEEHWTLRIDAEVRKVAYDMEGVSK